MFNVPPGSMKSTIISVCLPAWIWTWWPEWTGLFISGADDVSIRDSMKCRTLVTSEWYRGFNLPWGLAKDQDAKGWFKNTKGGERQATTIGSRGTGKRVHHVFFDDPNDTKEISEPKLNAVWDAFRLTFQNRLKNMVTGGLCLIQQRTHMMDLTGHLLDLEPEFWQKIIIREEFEVEDEFAHPDDPRTEEGELMFPVRFPPSVIETEKRRLQAVGYAGQHQQRPTPLKGVMFDVDKILIVDDLPQRCHDALRARAWDFAYSEGRGDYTASAMGLMDWDDPAFEGMLYICDVTEKQVRNPLTELKECLTTDRFDVHVRIPRDPGGGSRTADEAITMCAGRVVGDWRPTREKTSTWLALASWVNAGRVRFLRGAWNQRLKDQMNAAPKPKHDDMMDGCTELHGYLSKMGPGEAFIGYL
jgi:phage terminase large subunit-like protein